MLPTAPVIEHSDGTIVLDTKFAEGMQLICETWNGRVDCILRRGADSIPFGTTYENPNFEYGLHIVDTQEPITKDLINQYDLVLATGDNHLNLPIAECVGKISARVVHAIEYTLETRLQITRLDKGRNLPRRLY